MRDEVTTAPNRPRKTICKPMFDAAQPLPDAKRELFAQRVASGMPVKAAYESCGYKGKSSCSISEVRRHPAVDARVRWLLSDRIEADTKRRHRAEKIVEDVRVRLALRLEQIALGDVRDVVQWHRKPVINDDGDVIGFSDEMDLTPSHKLKPEQAAMVRGVFKKGNGVRLEFVDQLAAMEKLAKMLGMFQVVSPPVVNNTVNQVNIHGDAVEAVRRVAFMLESARLKLESTVATPSICTEPKVSE